MFSDDPSGSRVSQTRASRCRIGRQMGQPRPENTCSPQLEWTATPRSKAIRSRGAGRGTMKTMRSDDCAILVREAMAEQDRLGTTTGSSSRQGLRRVRQATSGRRLTANARRHGRTTRCISASTDWRAWAPKAIVASTARVRRFLCGTGIGATIPLSADPGNAQRPIAPEGRCRSPSSSSSPSGSGVPAPLQVNQRPLTGTRRAPTTSNVELPRRWSRGESQPTCETEAGVDNADRYTGVGS